MIESQENPHFLDYWRVIQSRKEIIIAIFLLVVLGGFVVTYTMPKTYMASAVIRVAEESESRETEVFGDRYVRYDPLYLRTQFEIIQSRGVIEEVVRNLNLAEELGRAYGYLDALGDRSFDYTRQLISNAMRVEQYRDTSLIQVRIYLDEMGGQPDRAPQFAADIANNIAAVFRSQREAKNNRMVEQVLEAIKARVDERNKLVSQAQEEVDRIRERYKISVLASGADGDITDVNVGIRDLEGMRTKVRMELAAAEATYNTVTNLSPEALRAAAIHIVNDQVLARLITQRNDAEVELKQMLAGFGPKHPQVRAKQAVVDELDARIRESLNGLKIGVRSEYESAKEKLAILDADLNAKKEEQRLAESEGYKKFRTAREELERLKKMRDVLVARYEQESVDREMPTQAIEVIEFAKAPAADENVRPNHIVNIAISIVMGLGMGIGMAYFVEYLDTSVKTLDEIERYMGAPVLGVIPQKVKPFNDDISRATHGEAYRVLRANIQFSKTLARKKTLCITSGSVGEGKSLTLFNLACVCAELGDRVLMVDADLYRPRLHRMAGVARDFGLANVLVGEMDLDRAILPTSMSNLYLLPAGRLSGDAHGLLDTIRMKELIQEVSKQYDMVLFDVPPIIGVSDASVVGREMDGILLLIQHRKYPKSISMRAKRIVESIGGNLIGTVVNNINISRDYSCYYEHRAYSVYGRQNRSGKVRNNT